MGIFFLKNRILLLFLVLIFTLGGIFSYFQLNRREDPEFKIRTATVITEAFNRSAEDVDNQITRQIENSIFQMDEIEDVKSESYFDKSIIYVDLFEKFNNIQPIWDKLRRKITLSKQNMPNEINPIVNDEFDTVYGALISVSNNNVNYETLFDKTVELKNEYLKLSQRGRVEIFGQNKEVVYLKFMDSYFSNLHINLDEFQKQFSSFNLNDTFDKISYFDNNFLYGVNSYFKDYPDIAKFQINLNGKSIPLNSMFEVEKTIKKPFETLIRSNSNNCLLIGISLKKDGNILKWGKQIKELTTQLQEKNSNYKIDILILQSDYAKKLTDKFVQNLIESVILVASIVFLFLGLKAGLIVGFIVFCTIFSTFFIMKLFNIGLDKITLSALIISLGVLVDNSIVVIDYIFKNLKNNINKISLLAIKKFQKPLFLTSSIVVLSFLPVFIAKGALSEYASNLFVVILIVLFFSWFYSISLLPLLVSRFINIDDIKAGKNNFFIFVKNKVTQSFLNSGKIIKFGLSFLIFSLFIFFVIPKIFFPDSDRNMFEIRLNFGNNVSFDKNKNNVIKLENFLKNLPDVKDYISFIGTSAPRYVLSASSETDRENFSMFLVILNDYKKVDKNILLTKKFINENLLSAQAVVKKVPLGPPVDAPIEVRIYDNNINELFKKVNVVKNELSKIGDIYLIKDNWGDKVLEYDIQINQNQAIISDISAKTLRDFLKVYFNGKILTYYYRIDNKIPIILIGENNKNPNRIFDLTIYSDKFDSLIPINQVAKISPKFVAPKIIRRNNSYCVTVQGWINKASFNSVYNKLSKKLDKIGNLHYEFGGLYEKSKKGNSQILEKIPIAYLFVFLILIFFFNSLKLSFLILFCAFLSISGANIGLFLTRSDFGFITLLAYICLIGMCANNGFILFSELKNQKNIVETAKSRVEPVFLTCLTTILGMLPLWVKNDPMFSTLAVSIIFGLLTSIFITLFLLPNLYCLIIKSKLFNRN